MIYAWDNYPFGQFPGLWLWLEQEIIATRLVMPGVAFEEVGFVTPDCAEWLSACNLERLDITNAIATDTMRIKGLLGIRDDAYHPNGVGENDLLIIATARAHQAELISNEAVQLAPPLLMSRYKIPAVCALPAVAVPCMDFLRYLRRSGAVF